MATNKLTSKNQVTNNNVASARAVLDMKNTKAVLEERNKDPMTALLDRIEKLEYSVAILTKSLSGPDCIR